MIRRWPVLVLVATCSAPARAQPTEEAVRIQYTAPVGCPDAKAFATQLRERTQRGRFAEPGELARTFRVELAADAQGYSGQVGFLDDAGAPVNRRVHGEQCEAVVSSLALITALALDATIRPQASEPDPQPVALPANAPNPEPSPPTPAATTSPKRMKRSTLRAVRAGVQAGYGSTTSAPRLGVLGEVELRSGLALRLTAHYAWHELAVDAGRSADIRLLGMETAICPLRFDWGVWGMTPCAALDLGALRAAGVQSAQLTSAGDETIWWGSVSGQLAFSFRPNAPYWLELRAAAEFPLRAGYQFTFQNPAQIAYEVPYVSAWGGISAGVRFW